MENFSYNSYPDSGDSSPRSREIDFENPPPWEEPSQAQNYKAKFMCSYGGKIHPRPHDNQLSYIGGETKILAVERTVKFPQMIGKLSALYGDTDVAFKYQLPGEDLDALISVTNDDDLEHMMHEYDRLYRASGKPARMRLFLFPVASPGSFSSDGGGGRSDRETFMEALNSNPNQAADKAAAVSNVDFLFGLEKGVGVHPPPPIAAVKVSDPVPDPTEMPPPLVDRFVGLDHFINPMEIQMHLHQLQRLQIREQHEQQQQQQIQRQQQEIENLNRRSDDDNLVHPYNNSPAGDYYVQKIQEKNPPPQGAVQHTMNAQNTSFWPDQKHITGQGAVQHTMNAQNPSFWPDQKHITGQSGGVYSSEQPVYMIPGSGGDPPPPGAVFHHPIAKPMTGQSNQGYYSNVQRMPHDMYRDQQQQQQQAYNMVQTQQPPPMSTMAPPQQVGMGVVKQGVDAGYPPSQTAYDSRQLYYTAPGGMVVPVQYQGVGVPVSGGGGVVPEGKVVVTKVSQV